MYGKNIVENNKNTSGDFDDVYLDSFWFLYDAYIKGSADEGSHIGLRSNSSSKNKLGVDVTNYIEGTYFMDDSSNLHVVYYSSDKTLYQEKGESTKYNLTINGTVVGKYYSGQKATIYDNNDDYERVFLNWKNSDDISITTEQKEQRAFDINMPSHDVSVNAEYLERLKTITLTVLGDIPTATRELPTWVKYTYGPDDTSRWTSDIEWLEVSSETTTPTSGNAKYNTTYELKFQLPQDISKGISFSNEIKKDLNNVTIKFSDSDTVIHASSITLSGAGTLTVISEPFTTEKRLITGFRTDSITVQEGTPLDDLIKALPDTAVGYDEKGYEEKLSVDKQSIKEADLTGLISNGKVIYPTDGKTTIVLPITASADLDIAKSAKFKVKVNVTELPTINSITEAFVTVRDGTSRAYFLNELPVYAEIIASDGSIKFLNVDANSIGEQLDAHLTDEKIDYSKGSTFELNLDVVTDGTVKNPYTKKLKVNVTVSEKDKVESPSVNPASGEYKDEQLTKEGNLDVMLSYGDSAQIKGDTIHYIVDQGTEQTCSLSESTTSCTVTLEGTAKEKVSHTLEVWASGTEEYNDSTHIKNTYVLDNRITVEVPTVNVDSGTYNQEKLIVKPSASSGAEIWYTLNDGDPIQYDSSSEGIILTTEANVQKIYSLNIWAVIDGVSSEVVQREYILDYHVEPTKYNVTINCSDTAIVPTGETAWTTSVTQSYEKDTKVTIYAPEEDGRVFEKWTDKDGNTLSTDLWYTYDKLDDNKTIYAVYNPVITEINFSIPYPVGGEALATKDQIKATATVAGTSGKDIRNYFDLDNLSWLPEDTTADYETRYTLALPINHNIQNVKYVLAEDIVVKVNEKTEVVANIDTAKLIAYLTFPTTDIHQYILKEVEPVQDITMSYVDAYKQQVAQEEERQTEDPKNIWELPKETNLIVDDGSKLSSIITWDIPEFNKDSWTEQTLEVEGTVAIPSNVTQGEVSNKVKLIIHVLAPEQVSTPTSSVPTGIYKDTQLVTLTSETEGAKLYYTIDGTEPTKDSLLYTGSFKVKETTTIKVFAVYDGMIDSEVSTYTITIDRTPDPTPTPTPTPTATPEAKKITPKKSSGWDDGGPFTTDTCGNVYDRWGNKIYEAKGCNVGGYNLVPTDTKE